MRSYLYLAFGLAACASVAALNLRGARPLNDLLFSDTWDPREDGVGPGRSGFGTGIRYHK